METITIKIPSELKKEFEFMAQNKGQILNQYILDVLTEHMEQIVDEAMKDEIDNALQSRVLSQEESNKLLNELKS